MATLMAMTFNEIRRAGLEALKEKLGSVDFVRFFHRCETGHGDYTAEREEWLSTIDKSSFLEQVKGKQND